MLEPKMLEPPTLDARDEQLLLALEADARASVVALARIVGLSRSATQERLARLQRGGAIAGYTIRRGRFAQSERLRAWLLVGHTANGDCRQSAREIRRLGQVRSAYSITGDVDLLIEVDASGPAELEQVRSAIARIGGVASVASHLVLSTHFENRSAAEAG